MISHRENREEICHRGHREHRAEDEMPRRTLSEAEASEREKF